MKCPFPKEHEIHGWATTGNVNTAVTETGTQTMTVHGADTVTAERTGLTGNAASSPSASERLLGTSELQSVLDEIAASYPQGSKQKIAIRQAQAYCIANTELPPIK